MKYQNSIILDDDWKFIPRDERLMRSITKLKLIYDFIWKLNQLVGK